MVADYSEELDIKQLIEPDDYAGGCCALGGIIRANQDYFNLEIEIREGERGDNVT